jgi:transposase
MRPLAKTPRAMGGCPDCGARGSLHKQDCRKIRTKKLVRYWVESNKIGPFLGGR